MKLLLALLLPIPTPQAAAVGRRRPVLPPANSGEQRRWGRCFSPSFSSCPVSTPRLGVPSWSWCQLIPAVRRPTLHPASRGSQRWCGRRGCRLVIHQLEVAMWQEVLTSCLSHFPGLPDTSYAVSHPICIGRRGWDSPCCQTVVVT
jgi:hypothetical protein